MAGETNVIQNINSSLYINRNKQGFSKYQKLTQVYGFIMMQWLIMASSQIVTKYKQNNTGNLLPNGQHS